ncbi:MAG TPA: UDP-2,3-diacylglucosamine diphosphatase, partial [Bacteroidia bacterium]|nr:UDP-2,3-diacylglucosamine diphosphatase [Bacteroidia bacterium]
HYLNSGDWVESMTALVETEKGEWKIIEYAGWLAGQSAADTVSETPTIKLASA